ncbi:MAG: hypothetical protein JWO31_3226 [Phycisphaerales bacterium]|nr:hypothetical protein [Phycisphaerales bacterium]
MGAIYRVTYTKPLPAGAELFTRGGERHARWTDRKGRKRTAKVTVGRDGTDRIVLESATHVAKYRDGAGVVRTVGTGCRMKDAASAVLRGLTDRAQLVKAKVLTVAQDAVANHASTATDEHAAAYLLALGRKASRLHVANVRRLLTRVCRECRFVQLSDLRGDALEGWLARRQQEGMSARTVNTHLSAVVGFANWCCENDRLIVNPFERVAKADERAGRRRTRRSLTDDELVRLLAVARQRPLAEFGRTAEKVEPDPSRPKRANWRRVPLDYATLAMAVERARLVLSKRPDFVAELERRGRERALVYKALVLTGLRKGELASLTVGQLDLNPERPYVVLAVADEKNRQGSEIPLRPDLAADLRSWLSDRAGEQRAATRMKFGRGRSDRNPASEPVFDVPTGLIRILDRDLVAAGIPKRDDRGRTVDVHAMRTTFGTHLSKGGVSLRTAQAAMRHSRPDLTANVYTDPRLLDVAGALDVLPELSLGPTTGDSVRSRATGTDGAPAPTRSLVPTLLPPAGNARHFLATADKRVVNITAAAAADRPCVDAAGDNEKPPLTLAVSGGHQERAKGFEPSTFSLEG